MNSPAAAIPRRSDPQDARGAWRGLVALCVTVTTSYGVLFYAFPVLAPAISADTGWSLTTVTAWFSGAQVMAGLGGILVGRWLQAHGPRSVMTAAGVLAVPATVGLAFSPSVEAFAVAWLVAGVAMSGLFYPPAFAALTGWFTTHRVRALMVLTLVAGLASTIFAPLTAALEATWGWRGAYLVLAGVLAIVVVPLHAFALPHGWERAHAGDRTSTDAAVLAREAVRSRAFWTLTFALAAGSLTVFAVIVNLVPLLDERGFDTATAAWILGLGGVGQVLGRLIYPPLERRTTPVARMVGVLAACAVTTVLLGLVPGPWTVLVLISVLAGMARGVLTLLQATAVADRWGTRSYASLNGLMHTPIMLAIALAPWAGAALATPLGGYPAAFTALGVLGAIAAMVSLASRPAPSQLP